jgi:hypothetical protein
MVPAPEAGVTDQSTTVLVVPVTVAANGTVEQVSTLDGLGATATVTVPGGGGGGVVPDPPPQAAKVPSKSQDPHVRLRLRKQRPIIPVCLLRHEKWRTIVSVTDGRGQWR